MSTDFVDTYEIVHNISWELGRISTHCYMIRRGVRAAAHETVHNDAAGEVRKTLLTHEMIWAEVPCGDNHTDFTFWEHEHVGKAVTYLQTYGDTLPVCVRCYLWGKIFGYSEEEIGRFLRDHAGD